MTKKEIRSILARMTDEEREEYVSDNGITTIDGYALSETNMKLIGFQLKEKNLSPTIVGGFRQWIKAGRVVKKGEHGFSILYPRAYRDKETDEDHLNFGVGTVFDISQTTILES